MVLSKKNMDERKALSMEKNKLHIEKNTIQETLIIPLYARKICTQIFPTIYSDSETVKLIDQLDYDFSALERKSSCLMQRFGALEVAMRQTDIASEVTASFCLFLDLS